jgi:hypothetical protein
LRASSKSSGGDSEPVAVIYDLAEETAITLKRHKLTK